MTLYELAIAGIICNILSGVAISLYLLFSRKSISSVSRSVSLKIQNGECGMLKFCLCLPEQSCHDVVSRKLTVSIGEKEPVVTLLDAKVVEHDGLFGVHGDVVSGSLVDVDAAGNESKPSVFSFTLVDSFPPPMPGQVGLKVVEQIHPVVELHQEEVVPSEPEGSVEAEVPAEPVEPEVDGEEGKL